MSVIRHLSEKYGFRFSKGLGQNFLINPGVVSKIADAGVPDRSYGIIEVGPGFGTLTRELAKRAKKVVAVEKDRRLIPVLAETLEGFGNAEVINGDILKTDVGALIDRCFAGFENIAVCSNLPYYITSPVIMYLLESRVKIKSLTVMAQKEAAVRICAEPGSRESGAVSIAVRFYSEPKPLFNVSRGSFMPSPDVDSSVIRLDIKEKTPAVSNEELFFKIVRGAFSQRRKNLVNSISSALGIEKPVILRALGEAGISPDMRPERMKTDEFIAVADVISLSCGRGE
jgi:16S rRNA (adenine1518-N6/adenine1519-N6)-dimethyltransferase